MTPEIELLYCPTCRHDSLIEAPPCPDGHESCPDRACLECGTAFVFDAGLALDAGLDDLVVADHSTPRTLRRGAA